MAWNGRPCAGTPALIKNNEACGRGGGNQEIPKTWGVQGRHREASPETQTICGLADWLTSSPEDPPARGSDSAVRVPWEMAPRRQARV